MTFLNWLILPALAAVAIPVLIHLLNRRRARVVDWGAMGFLLASLAARSKRILVEEIILLVLRCLVMALAVLAVARPFLPSRPSATWIVLFPCVLLGAVAFSLAATMWGDRRLRRWLLVAGAVLLALPAAAAAFEHVYQQSRWSFGGGRQDVAIVIDGSGSMSLTYEGRTNFQRAVDEARTVLAACSRGDGVAVIVAGASPQAVVSRPTTDRQEVEAALAGATAGGGTMRVGPALQLASAVLAEGANPARKIVVITDGQDAGWDVRAEAAWRQIGSALRAHPVPPQIIIRVLSPPRTFRNLAVTDLTFGRRIIGTDRPVEAAVRVENTGTEVLTGQGVRLLVDGKAAGEAKVERLQPNAAETVLFRLRLGRAGRHVVTAALAEADDMPADDSAERVVDVLSELGVLIVDGAPSKTALAGAGDYLAIALAPPRGALAAIEANATASIIRPRTVAATDLADEKDLDRYAAVMLADVPLLPKAAAGELAAYVRRGGGLLVAAGRHASAEFYNAWQDEAGQAVLPGRLVKLRSGGRQPPGLAPDSLTHPAVAKLADERSSDAARAMFGTYWQIEAGEGQTVAARLAGGEPLLLERRLGGGRVMLIGCGLHTTCTNLPALKCFVPLMHELTYHLAAPAAATANVNAGADVVVELPAQRERVQETSTAPGKALPLAGGGRSPDGTKTVASTTRSPSAPGMYAKGDEVVVLTPRGERRLATVLQDGASLRLQLAEARQGGVYRVMLKSEAAARFAPLLDGNAVPIAVVTPGGESSMAMLTDEDLAAARGALLESAGEGAEPDKMLARVDSAAELVAAVAGGVPGKELWQYVAMGLLAVLLGEIALTRHIAARRRSNEAKPVTFGPAGGDVPAFRRRKVRLNAK